jgi:hypothetical protein
MDHLLCITCPAIPIEIKDRLVWGVATSSTLAGISGARSASLAATLIRLFLLAAH